MKTLFAFSIFSQIQIVWRSHSCLPRWLFTRTHTQPAHIKSNSIFNSCLLFFHSGIAFTRVLGIEYHSRCITFHILQSYTWFESVMCAETLYERRLFGRWCIKRIEEWISSSDCQSTSHCQCAAMGSPNALTKGYTNWRALRSLERLCLSKHVQVNRHFVYIFLLHSIKQSSADFIVHSFNSSIIHGRYQHLALIDLDEFIIPRYNNTLSELLK